MRDSEKHELKSYLPFFSTGLFEVQLIYPSAAYKQVLYIYYTDYDNMAVVYSNIMYHKGPMMVNVVEEFSWIMSRTTSLTSEQLDKAYIALKSKGISTKDMKPIQHGVTSEWRWQLQWHLHFC